MRIVYSWMSIKWQPFTLYFAARNQSSEIIVQKNGKLNLY